jgi:hypothetical protein
MVPAIQALSDPGLERRNFLTVLFGSSGSGKSRLSLTYPDPLIVDLDGTIGRFREHAQARVAYLETDQDIIALAKAIASNEVSVKTLVIDGFTRLVQRLESELGTLHRDAYYRTYRERIDTLMRALSMIPCNVVLTARARAIRAKAGDVVGGYLVAAGESVPIGETPDVPPGVTDSADLVLHLESTDEAWSAETVKSLLVELPQHENFAEPITQIPERIEAVSKRLRDVPQPEPPTPQAPPPATIAIAPAAMQPPDTEQPKAAATAVAENTIPTNAELKNILGERNRALGESSQHKSVLDYLAKACGWNQVLPVPNDIRILAKEQMLREIEATKPIAQTDSPEELAEYIKERLPGTVDVPAASAPASPPAAPRKVTNADLLTILRQRNTACPPAIGTVPEYMRTQCGLAHVKSATDITAEDRVAMFDRATQEIADANPIRSAAAHKD